MKVDLTDTTCTVTRESGDPKFRDGSWGDGESRLLYHIQRILKARGMDIIKKRMWKDGHMVDNDQQYLRTRNAKCSKPHVYIYNGRWAIESAAEVFNRDGVVTLTVIQDVFKG